MDTLVNTVRRAVPGFTERALTYEDFLACCRMQGIIVETRPDPFDEYLSRRGRCSRITLNTGLTPLYKTFLGFHALGHWFGHPGDQEFHLGSPGWLHHTELEASTVGFLALSPWPDGPPYPRLEKAYAEGDEMQFWVQYPRKVLIPPGEAVDVAGWRPAHLRRPASEARETVIWWTKKTVIVRHLGQLA
jgi:hypothetical protein